ncbi:MAG: hypothetical protein EZS28_022990, partial [Streblomastix strix]
MLISFLFYLISFTTVNLAFLPKSDNINNQLINLYVNEWSGNLVECGYDPVHPCKNLDTVLGSVYSNNSYIIHVGNGQYTHDLLIYFFISVTLQDSLYINVDIVAEGDAQINITGTNNPIGQIIISFSKFSIDFGDLFFFINDIGSSLKFSSCNLFRNAGNSAINSHSLAIVSYGSLILENLNINGNNKQGNQPLIQATSPQLIQFTSLIINNLSLLSGNNQPILLSVTYNQTSPLNNDNSSTKPIILIEKSELVQNTLAPIQESCSIQLEGLKPQQILIKNSTFNNRSPPNANKHYEFKIILPSGSKSQDLINQFQTVDFGIALNPVAVKVPPNDQFVTLVLPLSDEYANIRVNSNGQEQCTSYIANYYNDVQSVGCAVIIIRSQDYQGLFRGIERIISVSGSFTENDLRTDDLHVSFTGLNSQTQQNWISFTPNLPISNNSIDNALFRIREGGLITLNNLFIQRYNQNGSENAPIVIIISESEQQSNEIGKNSVGQIIIEKCILEGGNSAFSDVWYNLGLAETCNVGYGAAIVADSQSVVQISGSTIKTFEGPAVRALNGASVTINKNTILDNNGLRNRNTLSSMQTNVVCEGGIGTTTIDIALDNVNSFTSTKNGWIFSSSQSNCDVKATFNGETALPRSLPSINSANVTINNTNQTAQVTINGKFLEPCMVVLLLEIHEKNKVDKRVIFEFGIESSSITTNWINSENTIIQIPYIQLKDLNISSEWEVSIYESGKREQTNWVTALRTIDGKTDPVRPDETEEDEPDDQQQKEKQSKIKLIIIIVVPIVVVIIVVIIIIIEMSNIIEDIDSQYSKDQIPTEDFYQEGDSTSQPPDSEISYSTSSICCHHLGPHFFLFYYETLPLGPLPPDPLL